jgi:signal transduction histidine kinase
MISAITRAVRERFGIKILLAFTVGIVVSLSVFTTIVALRESDRLRGALLERGEAYAGLLAEGAVIGIFSENAELLRQAARGVVAARDVVAVGMYNADGKLLYAEPGTPEKRHGFAPLRVAGEPTETPRTMDASDSVAILFPVLSAPPAARDDSIYFGPDKAASPRRTLGYVQVVLSKASYRKEILSIVLRNVLLMAAFIVMSLFIVAFTVRRVLRPLERLTDQVRAFRQGMSVEPAPVETRDEVGRLAAALNEMVAARRAAEKELYAVAAEMTAMETRIEERERYQIAADLHDFVGQNLVLTQFKLGALARCLASPDDQRRIEELREVIDRTIQYTRSLTVELSPPNLAEIGLSAAVEAMAEGFSRAYGVRISVRDHAGKQQLDREARYLLYRNIREMLVNVVKHSRATEATVSLSLSGDRLRIAVADNGRGFELQEVENEKGGFGLFAIRERMERIGGACEIDARPGGGTTVVLTVRTRGTGDAEEEKT